MAKVTGILCQIVTGNVDNAGTDGRVYLGLGGREFRLDSSADDYERGSWREYILGEGGWSQDPSGFPPLTRVQNEEYNDPRVGFPLDTVNLTRTPVYIRFEPDGPSPNWNLAFAAALVYDPPFVVGYTPPVDFDYLWLGDPMGKMLYLTEEHWRGEMPIRNMARELAQAGKASIS